MLKSKYYEQKVVYWQMQDSSKDFSLTSIVVVVVVVIIA